MTDFESWLRKGLGRAAVFLKANDSQPWREQLLYACTHDLTYNRQCEESRAFYLQTLIEFSRDAEFYSDRIIASLATDDDDLYLTQIFELAVTFANQCSSARKPCMPHLIVVMVLSERVSGVPNSWLSSTD